ncbi:MAG: hypothetical protein RMJ00_05910 [Nitrososphaerota archaeon]|nr:hypothetical protein [Candidatus Bathyarchaeota archaeon]MDW8062214.1 hypothetical protein [Nitrososphaerota archaeon]
MFDAYGSVDADTIDIGECFYGEGIVRTARKRRRIHLLGIRVFSKGLDVGWGYDKRCYGSIRG